MSALVRKLLLFGVPLERQRDEAVEQRRDSCTPDAAHSFEYMLIVVNPGMCSPR